MIRWLSIGVILYMVLGIIWWGLLLNRKNNELYELKIKESITQESKDQWMEVQSKQRTMIIGEGLVLGLSLLLGIYIIYRSASREISIARSQSDLLLSVSHELKSPIAAIKLAFQTLKREGITTSQKEKFLRSGIEDTNRLEKMVQNILLSANIDEKPLQLYYSSFDLSDQVTRLINNIRSEHPEFTFETGNLRPEIQIEGDSNNLKLVFSNLFENAIKYSNKEKLISVAIKKEVNSVLVTIKNSGSKLEKREIPLLFEKFYRGQNDQSQRTEGTGLGLYIAHKIVDAHNGTIQVYQTNGFISFIIKLPQSV